MNVFVGYPNVTVEYSSITLKKEVFVTYNVKFLEKEFFCEKLSGRTIEL